MKEQVQYDKCIPDRTLTGTKSDMSAQISVSNSTERRKAICNLQEVM